MSDRNYSRYIRRACSTLIKNAFEAKRKADSAEEGGNDDNSSGYLMAYDAVIYFMKLQAPYFGLVQRDLGLEDIDPEADLLSLRPRETWEEERLFESKSFTSYVQYVNDILSRRALEAKLKADQPEEGYADFNAGYLRGYRDAINAMKKAAPAFDLSQKDIGLENMDPEIDLQPS